MSENIYNEGLCYYWGTNGYPFDYTLAYEKFLQAAKLNNVNAIYMLGFMHKDGLGVPKDYEKALRLFSNAANQGSVDAKVILGDMYYNGLGVPKNIDMAYKFYSAGVEERHAGACFMAGIIACNNFHNYDWAFRLFCTTINKNYNVKESYHNLGYICEKGKGPTPGKKEAYGYYLKAAEMGYTDSMFATARILYLNGMKREAIEWGERAANNGHKEAAKFLLLWKRTL